MAEVCEKKLEVAARVAEGYAVLDGSAQASFDRERVVKASGTTMRVERSLVALNESEMRHHLGVPRLLKAHTRGLHTVTLPAEDNAASLHTFSWIPIGLIES